MGQQDLLAQENYMDHKNEDMADDNQDNDLPIDDSYYAFIYSSKILPRHKLPNLFNTIATTRDRKGVPTAREFLSRGSSYAVIMPLLPLLLLVPTQYYYYYY